MSDMLTDELVRFIPRHTSMCVAARTSDHLPVVGRAMGCRASDDRRRIVVFLSTTREGEVLECLRDNAAIALTVTRPTSHETLQFKGKVVEIRPLSGHDRSEIRMYQESFVEELGSLGYQQAFAWNLVAGGDDCVAVVFEPAEIYNQTPGPRAGARLGKLS